MEAMDSGLDRYPDYGFAFNDRNFSDRILRIEIVADPTEAPPVSKPYQTLPDLWGVAEEENGDEPAASAACGDDSNGSEDGSPVLGVKNLHISSPILAAKSPFFYKLFTNGMMESEQRHVTLRINASEEAALIELLNFMYSNTLRANTAPALLDVLVAADKFEVTSCMTHCYRFLRNLALTSEIALLYVNLPSSILTAEAFQPLLDAAIPLVVAHYKDVSKHIDEIMNLPLAGIEAILSSDDLQVASEDVVYDIALNWTWSHYQKDEERRDILSTRLGRYIRFPFMTSHKLRKVLTCNHFNQDFATKAVLEALFFKTDAPHRQRAHILKDSASAGHLFMERAYKYLPIKVVEFEIPRQQCVVYLDLKREECVGLYPSSQIYSKAFHLGGQGFFLSAHFYMDPQSLSNCFGVSLGMKENGSLTIDLELAVRSKPLEKYITQYKGDYVFTGGPLNGGEALKYRNLLSIPWTSFIVDDSPYIINGVLHFRAQLTVKR